MANYRNLHKRVLEETASPSTQATVSFQASDHPNITQDDEKLTPEAGSGFDDLATDCQWCDDPSQRSFGLYDEMAE